MTRHLQSTPAQSHFLLEIRALAQLEHKNIARLLDGGVTPGGLTYVAMEYIEGRRLDSFCDELAVSIEHVLQLILQLCSAVDYVHSPGMTYWDDVGGAGKLSLLISS
jgi:serine/threonine protein kinase